jgi:hypothetical protein
VGVVDARTTWWLLENLTIVVVLCYKLVLPIVSIMWLRSCRNACSGMWSMVDRNTPCAPEVCQLRCRHGWWRKMVQHILEVGIKLRIESGLETINLLHGIDKACVDILYMVTN